jgi:hypothetical protein
LVPKNRRTNDHGQIDFQSAVLKKMLETATGPSRHGLVARLSPKLANIVLSFEFKIKQRRFASVATTLAICEEDRLALFVRFITPK